MRVQDEDLSSAVELLHRAALARTPLGVHLCNAYTLTLAARDPAYAQLLEHRSLNLPDGVPVVWFSRLQTRRRQRGPVRGPSLMREALRRDGFDHFFLGATDAVLAQLRDVATVAQPNVRIVGALAPPFRNLTDEDLRAYAEAVEESGANVVWVGLGTPKQDEVIAALVDRVDVVAVGVGAAFDFLSHNKKEAPAFLHGTGLEWSYRLATEPRRLWRRYLVGNVLFAFHAAANLGRRSRG